MTLREPVVTLPLPWPIYIFGSLILWLLKTAVFAVVIIAMILALPVWIPLQRRYTRHG